MNNKLIDLDLLIVPIHCITDNRIYTICFFITIWLNVNIINKYT